MTNGQCDRRLWGGKGIAGKETDCRFSFYCPPVRGCYSILLIEELFGVPYSARAFSLALACCPVPGTGAGCSPPSWRHFWRFSGWSRPRQAGSIRGPCGVARLAFWRFAAPLGRRWATSNRIGACRRGVRRPLSYHGQAQAQEGPSPPPCA